MQRWIRAFILTILGLLLAGAGTEAAMDYVHASSAGREGVHTGSSVRTSEAVRQTWAAEPELESEPLLSFSVLSDIHITSWDAEAHRRLREALADHAEIRKDSKLLVLNGDLTDGDEADYRSLLAILNHTAHPPVHATMGNHDYYRLWRGPDGKMDTTRLNPAWSSKQAVEQFMRMFHYDKPYHELVSEGYHFLFLSGEAYRDVQPTVGEDAYLSPEQLGWLRERLQAAAAEDPHKPVFVFLHQPLPGTLDGTDRERGIVQHQELRALLDAHPNVILFSGHTHWNLESTQQVKQLRFLAASSASIRQVWNGQNEPESRSLSQSLVVDVYKDHVIINRREHSKRRWIQPSINKGYDVS
ncbi:metallophosphoesterase family protein [Paenibacillus hexagrammi]|uniref:Metallophosphoesterase n=1 Tax=Paenibacillus hexagrammi TaxID=2908839 RepID=A0ABY3SI82_9BACL|nr:metallophosphoesterase [Paenibacillus sp. YPD9-1]UJF32851.1 metallophosphoesterase [Paenibacillus sp. YPD9-1]